MSNNNENITPAALLEQLVYVDTFMPEIDDPSQLDERLTAELSAFADESFIFPDEEKPAKPNESTSAESHGVGAGNNSGVKPQDHHTPTSNHEELLKRFNEINNSFASNQVNSQGPQQQQQQQQPKFNTLQQTNSLNTGISNILSPLSHQQDQNPITTNPNLTNSNNIGNDLLSNLPKVPVPPGAQSSLIAAGLSQTQIDALAALIAQHQGGVDGDRPSNDNHGIEGLGGSLNTLINPSQSLLNPSSSSTNGGGSIADTPPSTTGYSGGHSRSNSLIKSEHGSFSGQGGLGGGEVDLDKRRRNTAASARFRIKKKLKEQQLERNVRELNELTITLEKKIQTLEMENKLLRNLVVEKGEQKNNDELEYLKKKAKLAIGDGSGRSSDRLGGANNIGSASNF